MLRSIQAKMILSMTFTVFSVGAIVFFITPYMVEQSMLRHAVDQFATMYQRLIEGYIAEHQQWGTQTSAVHFSQSEDLLLVDEVTDTVSVRIEFAVFDLNGHILRSANNTLAPGERMNESTYADAKPIMIGDNVVAYLMVYGELPISPWEKVYLIEFAKALAYSLLIAVAILLPVVIWHGNRLSRVLVGLNSAVKKMGKGELEQQVPVTTNDELGQLARAFNTMNRRLVTAYNELSQSHDVIERQAVQLRELSIRDELTGLYNRRFFIEEINMILAAAKRYGTPMTLVLGDVDFFKKINDEYSHSTGDQVLKQVAAILADQVRGSDVLARYGGEEMILALPNTTLANGESQVERMRQVIEHYPWHNIADRLQVTISFGLAALLPGEPYDELFERADAQLYRAKHEGRNRVCVDNEHT